MKTILAPTDFSKISRNAIDYAVEMAKLSKSKLVLFHAFHAPVIISEVPVVVPSPEEIEKDCLRQLKKIKNNLRSIHGDKLNIDVVCKYGLAVDEIVDYSKENQVDLITMGMQGAGYFEEKLVGSVTTSLIQKTQIPVLSIDKDVKFKTIKKIAFACDYEELKNISVISPLREIAGLFKSHIYILNVLPENILIPTVNQAIQGVKMEHSLEDLNHSFHTTTNKNVVEGINDFVNEHEIDLVVMIPRNHAIFKGFFKGRTTKKMAFHTTVPLLTLHE